MAVAPDTHRYAGYPTMSTADPFPHPSQPFPKRGEPAWDLALMFPLQGGWSVQDYLALDTGLLVEYTDGFVRVLPMPSLLHQLIVKFLFRMLDDFVSGRELGEVLLAPLPVELAANKYREPDLVFLRPERMKSLRGQPAGADLAVEVVSEGKQNRQRDYLEKRREYAEVGIAKYWIVDPEERKFTVLVLNGNAYREHGVFVAGQTAASVLLAGFQVDVNQLFAKCDEADPS
jgi:Uma2 family endonuclease